MNKRFLDQCQKFLYKNQQTPLSIGTLCVVMLCLLGLVVATFTQINLIHYWFGNNPDGSIGMFIKNYPYIPQIPILLGIVGILGTRFSLLTATLYVLMGFFLWPVFALGGGLGYVKSTFFGYILGYFPAIIIAGRILMKNKSLKNIILAALFGVLAIHVCGILYSTLLGIFKLVDFSNISTTIIAMTGTKICYDWIISIAAISASIPVKQFLWLAMDNGIARKPKKKKVKKTEDVELYEMQEA